MTKTPISPPDADELHALKQDAAHNVADAHDSLHGNLEALARWRAQREAQASINKVD